jgi:hypothetical protein
LAFFVFAAISSSSSSFNTAEATTESVDPSQYRKAPYVGRTFLYNRLMLFYAISPGLSRDKENKKSLGSSVADDIKDNEITNETMPTSISNPKEEEEEEG